MAVLSPREKVSIFLAILGPEISAKILRYLPEEMAVLIASGVNKIMPSREEVGLVLKDFGRLFLAGGPAAFLSLNGERGEKPAPTLEELLRGVSPKKLFNLLSKEKAQTVAFILARFPLRVFEEALTLFSPEVRTKIEVAREKIRFLPIGEKLTEPIKQVIIKNLM